MCCRKQKLTTLNWLHCKLFIFFVVIFVVVCMLFFFGNVLLTHTHTQKNVVYISLVKGENMTKLIEYLTVDIRLDFSSFSRDFTLAERMKMGSSIPLLGSVPPPSSSTRSSSSPQKDYISLRDSIEFYAEKMNAKMLEMQKQIEMAESSSQKKNESDDDDSNEENDKEWESDQKTNEGDETEPITTANESSLATEGNGSEDNQATQESKEEEEEAAETTTTTTVGKNNNNDIDNNSQSEQQESSISSPQVYFDEERLEKRIRKYPQLAADILACDIDQLYTAIVSDKVLLSALFGFLSNEYPLNPLLAGYWLKVLRGLYQKKIFDVCISICIYIYIFCCCYTTCSDHNILDTNSLLCLCVYCVSSFVLFFLVHSCAVDEVHSVSG